MDKSSEQNQNEPASNNQPATTDSPGQTNSPKPAIDKEDVENAPTFEEGWDEQKKYGAD